MINWNTDELLLKKQFPKKYKIWRITQLINYGLEGEKIDKNFVILNWNEIKDKLDLHKRKTIEWLLWKTPYTKQSA
jgi:hypothetical protein